MRFHLTKNLLKIVSSVLSNLGAGWIGSLVIIPGLFSNRPPIEIASLLTYSVSFAIVSMLAAARIEDQLDNGKF